MKGKSILLILILTGCAGFSPELGIENGKFSACPASPNCVSSMSKEEKSYIKPIVTADTPAEIDKKIMTIINQNDKAKITIHEESYIRAEYRSSFFRFVDDVEFYFPETDKEEITIHVRSASRIGYSDMGVNRERIENIRNIFKNMSTNSD